MSERSEFEQALKNGAVVKREAITRWREDILITVPHPTPTPPPLQPTPPTPT
ncbi:MAG: hypothetical protein HOE82_07230 [Gammaproteobacteria bacterium]|nr:hypothetical protein [Gammaproteobacteria bacterium]